MRTEIQKPEKHARYWGLPAICGGEVYEMVLCPTTGDSTMDPENLGRYFSPQTSKDNPEANQKHPYQLVIPLQSGGTCAAHCKFCTYGCRKPATVYASPQVIVSLLQAGVNFARNEGAIEKIEQLKFSLLKGGEISLHPRFEAVLEAIYRAFPTVQVKISSIGSSNLKFLERIIAYRRRLPEHQVTLQISVNATDENQRSWLVNKEGSRTIKLYSLGELADYARQWKASSTGRRVSLTFTLMDMTVCDASTLIKIFSLEDVVFRLRRMHPETDTNYHLCSISGKDYADLYWPLIKAGFKVILGNPTFDEIEHILTQGWVA